jgi:hypothetical protein
MQNSLIDLILSVLSFLNGNGNGNGTRRGTLAYQVISRTDMETLRRINLR